MTGKRLTIIQLNDSHGYLEPHPELIWNGDHAVFRELGGIARIASLFEQIRNETNDHTITLDNGDTFHGTYPAVASNGKDLIPIFNELNIDAMTAHWEFAYGPDTFTCNVKQLNYPMLAINIYNKSNNKLLFPPYHIIERAGLKIGIIGIAATIVDKTMPASFSTGIYFTLGKEELPRYIKELRNIKQVDLVVVISHLGFPQEMKLASEVDGIDVLLSGHTHNRLETPVIVNQTIIIQSGCHGSFIGRLDLEIKEGQVTDYKHQLIPVDEKINPNKAMKAKVNSVLEPHREMLQKVVGYTETPLHRYTALESTMDNLLLAAINEAAGTTIAFSNGWRYGAPIVTGPITINDLWNIVPTNPPISIVELTGAELLEMIEENIEHTYSRDPYQQMGGYIKRALGINVYFKIENPYGYRIQEFFIGGKPLDKNKSYTVAFITAQGVPEKYGVNRRDLNILTIDTLQTYLTKHQTVDIKHNGTFILV